MSLRDKIMAADDGVYRELSHREAVAIQAHGVDWHWAQELVDEMWKWLDRDGQTELLREEDQ